MTFICAASVITKLPWHCPVDVLYLLIPIPIEERLLPEVF